MKIQHQKILAAAQKLGIAVKDVSDSMGKDAAVLEINGQSELLVRGTPSSVISVRSQYYCDNKALTKEAFSHLGIPAPKSVLFKNPDDPQLLDFFKQGNTYVCKPPDGTNGVGVEMNITTLKAVSDYLKKYKSQDNTVFMIEEQVPGEDLRVQVIGGKIVAVCTREPAHVIGDGKTSLEKLILNLQKKVRAQNPANDLVVDKTTNDLIADQHLVMTDIPEAGRTVVLKELANMAQGALAIDKTDAFHPGFQLWIDKLVDYLGTPYFAIDIIAKDLGAPPESGAYALEINARPEWLHHTFSEVRTHDLPTIVLNSIFS